MKAVLLSIKPKWCELIASGKKTIEIRKTKPKIEMPFKCYIYCTKDFYNSDYMPKNGRVIGEFVCDFINEYSAEFVDDDCYEEIRQIWKNEEEKDFPYTAIITTNEEENPDNCYLCNSSCLKFTEIKEYIGVNFHDIPFYGWHISDLKIYDEPKELSEFYGRTLVWRGNNHIHSYEQMTRPPQSWCYVEELDTL